jgi:hypothetical protein
MSSDMADRNAKLLAISLSLSLSLSLSTEEVCRGGFEEGGSRGERCLDRWCGEGKGITVEYIDCKIVEMRWYKPDHYVLCS